MENNRYYLHRAEIAAVSADLDVPVDIATDIVRRKHGWKEYGVSGQELMEWRKACRDAQLNRNGTLADLFADD